MPVLLYCSYYSIASFTVLLTLQYWIYCIVLQYCSCYNIACTALAHTIAHRAPNAYTVQTRILQYC